MGKRIIPSPATIRELISYDPETGLMVKRSSPGKAAMNTDSGRGYLQGGVCGIILKAHRVAWAIHYGEWPKGEIDHIDGDRRNNRIANLREVTRTENARNMKIKATNTSGATGVDWHTRDKRWRAKISDKGRSVWLGYFKTRDEAVTARKAAEARLGYRPNHGTRQK